MAGNLSSNININFTSNANKMTSELNELVNKFKEIASEGDALSASFKLLTEVLGKYESELNNCINACTGIVNTFGDLASGGIDILTDAFEILKDTIAETVNEVQRLSDIGIEIQKGYFALYNYLGEDAGNEIKEFANQLERVYNLDADNTIQNMRGILGVVTNMGLEAEESTEAIKELTMFAYDLSAYSGQSLEEVTGLFEKAMNFGSLKLGDALTNALDMDETFLEEFRELETVEERVQMLLEKGEKVRGTYARWLETSAGKIEQFNSMLGILEGNLAKLVTGLYAKIAPLLTGIIELVNNAVVSLSNILGIDITSASDNQAKSYQDLANSIEGVGEAAEKASKKTAKFDDVIQIKDNQNNSGGIGSNFEFDASGIINDTNNAIENVNKLTEHLKELFDGGYYKQMGIVISDEIAGLLDRVPWDNIQNKVYDTSKAFAEFFNGLSENNLLGYRIGDTLAEIINTGIVGLESLGENLDFTTLGKFLSASWNGFWEGLKTDDLANTVMTWFIGLFETINGFLSGNPFENTGSTLADLINSFFFGGTNSVTGEETLGLTSERMDEIVNAIIGFIDGIFNGIDTFLAEADLEGIKEKLKELITKLMTSFAENSGDWGKTLNDVFTTIFDTARELLETAETNGLRDGINNFLSGLDLAEILTSYLRLEVEKLKIKAKTELNIFWSTLGNFILDAIEKIWVLIKVTIAVALLALKALFWDLPQWFGQKGVEISDRIKEWWNTEVITWWNDVKSWGAEIITDIEQWFSELWQKFETWLANIWNTVTGWITDIRDAITGMFDGFSDLELNINTPFGSIGIDPSQWEIPFATGGIVNRATHALIGEAGREAVLPLENNTGWMDELASALVSKMNTNNNTGNNSITIDMSGYSKNFYTRAEMLEFGKQVVDALKLYGVNVAAIY